MLLSPSSVPKVTFEDSELWSGPGWWAPKLSFGGKDLLVAEAQLTICRATIIKQQNLLFILQSSSDDGDYDSNEWVRERESWYHFRMLCMIAEIYKEGQKRSQPKKFPFPKKKSQIQNLDFSWFSLAIFVLAERFLLYKQVILVSCQLVKTTGTNIFPYHFDNSLKILSLISFFSVSPSLLFCIIPFNTSQPLFLSQINLIE